MESLSSRGSGLPSRRIEREFVDPAVAGSWHVGSGQDGFEAAFEHDSADSGGSEGDALVGQVIHVLSVAHLE